MLGLNLATELSMCCDVMYKDYPGRTQQLVLQWIIFSVNYMEYGNIHHIAMYRDL